MDNEDEDLMDEALSHPFVKDSLFMQYQLLLYIWIPHFGPSKTMDFCHPYPPPTPKKKHHHLPNKSNHPLEPSHPLQSHNQMPIPRMENDENVDGRSRQERRLMGITGHDEDGEEGADIDVEATSSQHRISALYSITGLLLFYQGALQFFTCTALLALNGTTEALVYGVAKSGTDVGRLGMAHDFGALFQNHLMLFGMLYF